MPSSDIRSSATNQLNNINPKHRCLLTSPTVYPSMSSSSAASTISTQTRGSAKSAEEFAAAFGSLQANYGFGGFAPVVAPSTSKKPAKSRASATRAPQVAKHGKDYAVAAADLQSSYGFVGGAPAQTKAIAL
jgi:hypothetical protein